MENATKALLIVATVLITIVIIALGVLLLKNLNNSSQQVDKASNAISNATNSAYKDIINQRIKSYEKSYDNVKEAKEAYFNIAENIKEYNNLLSEGETKIDFEISIYFIKDATVNWWEGSAFEDQEEVLEILLEWSIVESENKMEIKRNIQGNKITIKIDLGNIKNHYFEDIFNYWK